MLEPVQQLYDGYVQFHFSQRTELQSTRCFLQSTRHISARGQWPLYITLVIAHVCDAMVSWFRPGGCAWAGRLKKAIAIPGPKGWPIIVSLMYMSVCLSHRRLQCLARTYGTKKLLAF